jgi:hypothetical protein
MKIIPNANHLNHPHSTETHGKARSGAKWFRDIVDLINPLHHIPLVGTLYRKITGDEIAPQLRVAGGALYAGPLGAAVTIGSFLLERVLGIEHDNLDSTKNTVSVQPEDANASKVSTPSLAMTRDLELTTRDSNTIGAIEHRLQKYTVLPSLLTPENSLIQEKEQKSLFKDDDARRGSGVNYSRNVTRNDPKASQSNLAERYEYDLANFRRLKKMKNNIQAPSHFSYRV